jgi:Tfp pilus assembly protein PilF
MRMMARIVSQHSALWSFDRWYRMAWCVGPGSLALLMVGWICIGSPASSNSRSWARPVNTPAKSTSLPVKYSAPADGPNQEITNCFVLQLLSACTGLIDGRKVEGRQLASVYTRRAFLRQEKQPDLALADYDAALKVEPTSADALNGRAWLHMARSEYDVAIEDLNKAVNLWPVTSAITAHYYRGYAFLKLEDYPKALADLNEAQKLADSTEVLQKKPPNNADIYLTRGEVQQALGDNVSALKDFDEYTRRAPKDYRGLVWRSFVLEETGRIQEALGAMEGALALEPDNNTLRAERDRLRKKQDEGNATR